MRWIHRVPGSAWSGCRTGSSRPTDSPKRWWWTNRPEFTSKALEVRAQRSGVKLHFITPGKPAENGYIASFNGGFQDERLNLHWFPNLADSRVMGDD